MGKELITDEMVGKFLDAMIEESAYFKHRWNKWLSENQPRQEEWEVVEVLDPIGIPMEIGGSIKYESGMNIHVVRRKSDGTELEVGKKYEIKGFHRVELCNPVTIHHFTHTDGIVDVYFTDISAGFNINYITSVTEVKPNPVLFVTEDGFPVHKGDNVFSVSDNFHKAEIRHIEDWRPGFNDRVFKEEANRDEYIRLHKPDKSLAMIREALLVNSKMDVNPYYTMEVIEQGLSKLKSKEV